MVQEDKTAYLECARLMQPPANTPKRLYGDVRRCRQRGRIKFGPIKVNPAQEDKTAYQKRASIVQPPRNDPKWPYRVIGLIGRRRKRSWIEIAPVKVKIKHINDKPAQEDETTHHGLVCAMQLPLNCSKRSRRVVGPRRQHGRLKSKSINVSQMREGGSAYLGRINTIRPMWRPIKGIKRLEELTSEYRIQGESWCDVEDHR